jgi:sugar O-acyltransferase (sialic acid O-acetyltransferase NeuD family)
MKVYGIYNAGGFGREVKPALERRLALEGDGPSRVIFIDDDEGLIGTEVNGAKVFSYAQLSAFENVNVCVAIASSKTRKAVFEKCKSHGYALFSIFADNFVKYDDVSIGQSAIFCHNTMVTSNVRIGEAFHCNIYSYVAHDCIVGDFVTFAPRVSLNGRIKVEDGVYVGSDATFLPGRPDKFMTIGEGAVIGAGAVVTRDVEPFTTVVGSPAKPLAKK